MLAEEVVVGAHPDDRLMLTAVGALRDKLVTVEAVDAAVAPRELGRAQPWFAAARAPGPRQRRLFGSHENTSGSPAQPGNEEAARLVAVRPELEEAPVALAGERWVALAEVVGLERRSVAGFERGGDQVFVLAP